jgi:acetyl-CoA acetyltransferase
MRKARILSVTALNREKGDTNMEKVAIVGAGIVRFGKFPQKRLEELGVAACLEALRDAQVPAQDIEAAYCGTARGGITAGQRVFAEIGITGRPVLNVENACASGSSAFRQAYLVVAAGIYETVLVLGIEQMTKQVSGLINVEGYSLEGDLGVVAPAEFAMRARRHIHLFGTTAEQIAHVSVKNHKFGSLNPHSQYQKECSLEEVLQSRMICDPLTLLECSPIGDGAAAVVVTSAPRARRLGRKPVWVVASAMTSGKYLSADDDFVSFPSTVESARKAYEQAGIGPDDIDFAEVHDCFAIAEIIHYEDLGFCERGEGGRFVESGLSSIGGKVAVNTSGGLLAKGHPIGATGVAQIVEAVRQLRGEAGARQVPNPRVGLTHNFGGFVSGCDVGVANVHIFQN